MPTQALTSPRLRHFWDALRTLDAKGSTRDASWPKNKTIFLNHPYSLSAPFLWMHSIQRVPRLKCAIEFLRGCNILVLVLEAPTASTDCIGLPEPR